MRVEVEAVGDAQKKCSWLKFKPLWIGTLHPGTALPACLGRFFVVVLAFVVCFAVVSSKRTSPPFPHNLSGGSPKLWRECLE